MPGHEGITAALVTVISEQAGAQQRLEVEGEACLGAAGLLH